MHAISKLRIVWTNACARYVLQNGFPFTTEPLDSMSVSELEQRTCHACHLAARWLSGISAPRRTLFIDATSRTSVFDIRFLPGHSGSRILTVSKGIWDMLTIWDISSCGARKACEWFLRGAVFRGLALNADPTSQATLAIGVESHNDGNHSVKVLSLHTDASGGLCSLQTRHDLPSSMKPTGMHGDLLAISDDGTQTVVWDLRTMTSAILQQPDEEEEQGNRSIQVVFAHRSILVVRACSIHLFPWPDLQAQNRTYAPLARHSFGWIDGICVAPGGNSLSILLRSESDDPWSSGLHSLDLYTLTANVDPEAVPYAFPPALATKGPAVRTGSVRCRRVILGPCGTAVWLQPQDRAIVGLAEVPLHALRVVNYESVVVAAFPGPLAQCAGDGPRSSAVFANNLNNWTALDYDEEMGRIALCSSFGRVVVLEL